MKFKQLKVYLEYHKNSWIPRRFLKGEYKRALQIERFVNQLPDREGHENLSKEELYQLILLTGKMADDISLVYNIKRDIRNEICQDIFQIYHYLKEGELFDFEHFLKLLSSYDDTLKSYADALGELPGFVTLNLETRTSLFALISKYSYANDKVLNFLRILKQHGQLNNDSLLHLTQSGCSLYWVNDYLSILAQSNRLNEETLFRVNSKYPSPFHNKLLSLLAKLNIDFDYQLLDEIQDILLINELVEVITILSNNPIFELNLGHIRTLLHIEDRFVFNSIQDLFKPLIKSNLLDEQTFLSCCELKGHKTLADVVNILDKNELLKNQNSLLNELLNTYKDNFSIYSSLKKYLALLDSNQLLNEQSLKAFFQLTIDYQDNIYTKPLDVLNYIITNSFCDLKQILGFVNQIQKGTTTLFRLLNKFQAHNFLIDKEQFNLLLSMPDNRLRRLINLLRLPNNKQQPDVDLFNHYLSIIQYKLEDVKPSTIVANNRELRKELILDNCISFFTQQDENVEDNQGSFGIVKKGYASADGNNILFAIKHLKSSKLEVHAKKEAKREVKRQRLLGRNAFYFLNSNDSYTIVSDWQSDKSIDKFGSIELRNATYEDRLHCMSSILNELNILHENYQVHGDIKAENCVMSLDNRSMNLIDFGTSRKIGINQHKNGGIYAWTPCYLDGRGTFFNYCDDIYALGLVFAQLFPELYRISLSSTPKVIQKSFEHQKIEKSITTLINNMISNDRKTRCSAKAALEICTRLIEHSEDFEMNIPKYM